MNKALEHHAEWIESYLRTTGGGANPSSVAINSTIVVASLLSEIVEQNNKIIELLSDSPFKDEEAKQEKPKETKFVKQAVLLNQLFKNGEEISDKTILKYLQDNNALATIDELRFAGLLHKNKRYTCKKGDALSATK